MSDNSKKSIVKKSILRKISTANYESLDISVEIEEEIEWKTIEERMDKTQKVSQILLKDFINTYNEVVKTIGVKKCIGKVTQKQSNNDSNKIDNNENNFDFLGE